MNWIDSHRRVDEGVTVGNCRMNRLLFADELVCGSACMDVLNRVFSTHLIGFLLRPTGTKISTKKTEALCLSRRPRQCILQVSGNTLQQVETFE